MDLGSDELSPLTTGDRRPGEASSEGQVSDDQPGIRQTVRIGSDRLKAELLTKEYPDGTLEEVRISVGSMGMATRVLHEAVSRLITELLKRGMTLEELVRLMMNTRYQPSGVVIGDDQIRECSSVIDWAMRHIGAHYLKNDGRYTGSPPRL